MKAILKSIKSKQCLNIMNHNQSILIIKDKRTATAIQKLIAKNEYAEIYVCCSKINKKHYHLIESVDTDTGKTEYEIDYYIGSKDYLDYCYEGKVAFKFRCYKVEEIKKYRGYYVTDSLWADHLLNKSCLTDDELRDYSKGVVSLYCIHISDLEIFDKPKELDEFHNAFKYKRVESVFGNNNIEKDEHTGGLRQPVKGGYEYVYPLIKAPQNFCYVEVKE